MCWEKIIVSVSIIADLKRIICFKRGGYDKNEIWKEGGSGIVRRSREPRQ